MTFAANVVRALHLGLVAFVIITPFVNDAHWSVFALHLMTIVTLLAHWWTNQNACFLTLLESMLRGIPQSKSFMYSLVSPVYQIKDADLRNIMHTVTPLLGVVSACRLSARWDSVKEDIRRSFTRLETA